MVILELMVFALLLVMACGTAWVRSLQPVELNDMGVCLK
jgi:hypothetical protein